MSDLPPAERSRVVVVAGPTAAGKTELAIRWALRFGGEIVNADSMQVYRYLDIGTAKPSPAQRARVPHHLLDVVTPDVQYTAGRYAGEARRVATAIGSRGRPVFLTGGSGLYIRAFLEGLIGGTPADPDLRQRLEAEHAEAVAEGEPDRLHRRLARLDPESAERIHPRDLRRIVRALEILALTGRQPSELRRDQRERAAAFRVLYLVLDPGREDLGRRIDARCAAMLEGGLLQEVRALREMGYGPQLPAMQAIGYRHLQPVVDGADTLAGVLPRLCRDTRRFARRQRTWFRGVGEAIWLRPEDESGAGAQIERFLTAGS